MLKPIHRMKSKAISFESGIEEKRSLKQVKMQVALLLELYDFVFPMVLSSRERCYMESVENSVGEPQYEPLELWSKAVPYTLEN